jgi:hypothetical protein
LASADVGSTMRVVVTASNSVGSATASSAATSVVSATPPLPPAGSASPYYAEHFDGGYTQPFWSANYPISWASGFSGQAGRIQDYANGTQLTGYGELDAIWAMQQHAYAGWLAGSGTGCCDGDGKHEDTWYRFKVRFPGGGVFKPNPGAMSIFETHVDDKTAAQAQSRGAHAYSNVLQVKSDGGGCSGVCTTTGTNPRLALRVIGGPVSQADLYGATNATYLEMPSNSLLIDHWYDIVIHIVLGESATNGYVQWWVDGQKIADVHAPTQYIRADATLSYGENVEFMNYRQVANWNSAIDFDELFLGPTASSVGFTP